MVLACIQVPVPLDSDWIGALATARERLAMFDRMACCGDDGIIVLRSILAAEMADIDTSLARHMTGEIIASSMLERTQLSDAIAHSGGKVTPLKSN